MPTLLALPLARLARAIAAGAWGLLLALLAAAHAGSAHADCIDDAARHHQVNADVLRAIGWLESRLNPAAVARNADGSIDRGAFQINSVHLPELSLHGVDARALDDGCTSAYVAAWHYRRQVARYGNSWTAVGAYHSRTPARGAWYANRVSAILMDWCVLPRSAPPFAASAVQAPLDTRARAAPAQTQGRGNRTSAESRAPPPAA